MFVDVPLRAETLPGPAIGEGYTLATSLMLRYSRGSVRLASAEPGTPPLIDPNYYSDPRDMEIFAAGLRAAGSARMRKQSSTPSCACTASADSGWPTPP
jgi:choline dehydrogenase